jgi:hypothetical protein
LNVKTTIVDTSIICMALYFILTNNFKKKSL